MLIISEHIAWLNINRLLDSNALYIRRPTVGSLHLFLKTRSRACLCQVEVWMEAIGTSGRPCRRGNETGAVCAETIYKPYVVAGCVAQSRVDARNVQVHSCQSTSWIMEQLFCCSCYWLRTVVSIFTNLFLCNHLLPPFHCSAWVRCCTRFTIDHLITPIPVCLQVGNSCKHTSMRVIFSF